MVLEYGGGGLMATGNYLVMLASSVFNENPSRIVASGFLVNGKSVKIFSKIPPWRITKVNAKSHISGADDTCNITLHYSGNRMASLLSVSCADLPNDAAIYGANGEKLRFPSYLWCPTKLGAGKIGLAH